MLVPLVLFGATGTLRGVDTVGWMGGFGGPGAIGMTPVFAGAVLTLAPPAAVAPELFTEPAVDFGDSDSFGPFTEPGVVAAGEVCATEFFREDFFDERVDPTVDTAFPLPRFLFLMTSVFSERGRTTPCSLRKRPQALHNG